ncbi:ABC transporter [Aeromicrobium endophyticum]|uniref:ABC transporter n=1 Tax=Aeromicrobium endophyticum TaxID=2292704 RepID=A0A371P931_9ACTN|nr:ABC transporter [Aeromicrobium endophyticum]REK72464.1 ABC transporter [Aeromicrobium endophyticum]
MTRLTRVALLAAALMTTTACSATSDAGAPASPPASKGHGAVAGAAEVAEPQLHVVSIDDRGATSMLDLLTDETTDLGSVTPPDSVTSDGRYVFAADETGVDVVDSGVWTWDHTDHFHYYRAAPRTVGRVDGEGRATISSGLLSTADGTGVFFPDSGEAVLLDNAALSRGRIDETLRLDVGPHDGLVAPLGDGAVVSEPDAQGRPAGLRVVDAEGRTIGGTACARASGTITTRVGLVVGCADGAVLATLDGDEPVLERIAYPDGAAAPATSFAARKGRPTVAGLGDGSGIWLLDTRERSWQWIETASPVVAAAAADDADTHVVALGEDGTVQVYDGTSGDQLAATDPLLASTLADPQLAPGVTLTVDAQRAYVNAAADGVVHEIDYADGARVARSLRTPTRPAHVAETGR